MKVLILPNLLDYMKERHWPDEMEDFIGNVYEVESDEGDGYHINGGWFVPVETCAVQTGKSTHKWKEGDKVINKNHPEFGVGIIIRLNGPDAIIDFENREDWCALISMDYYVPYEDVEKQSRTRWYNKGKLEEKVFFGTNYEIGDKVIHKEKKYLGLGQLKD